MCAYLRKPICAESLLYVGFHVQVVSMEMDTTELDKKTEGSKDEAVEQLLPPCPSSVDDIYGEPEVLPRVGDQYQAEIPPYITEHDHCQLIVKSDDTTPIDVPMLYLLGLPIPIVWAHDEAKSVQQDALEGCGRDAALSTNEPFEFFKDGEPKSAPNVADMEHKVGCMDILRYYERKGECSPGGGEKMGIKLVLHNPENKIKLYGGEKGWYPLPASLTASWSDLEENIFLLALYIFGKNFHLLTKFVDTKIMGEILSFYYGKFYRSHRHQRWSECRKIRSRKSVHGQKIFSGWRLQELLSRLSNHVPKECLDMLVQASRTFSEGKLSFEEYVFMFRNAVGANILIEAVGIGKGKQDLTGVNAEHVKSNHVFSLRPEIPTGKACSSLSSMDIIKFLTGNFRLSKARSSDLFWEAVWPRLLARGWHSEQPKNHGLPVSKNSLVFLVPGVKKFSKRRLVKGNHYFDSLSDVLNKVASDPNLLELEHDAAKDVEQNKEQNLDLQIKQDTCDSNQQRRCYLKPRVSSFNKDLMKFTVVDTSRIYGDEQSKVTELRSLPIDTPVDTSILEDERSEESQDDKNSTSIKDGSDHRACIGMPELRTTEPDSSTVATESQEGRSNHELNLGLSKKSTKDQFSCNVMSSHPNIFSSFDSAAVGLGESSFNIDNCISVDNKLSGEDMDIQVCSQNVSSACSVRDTLDDGNNHIANGTCPEVEVSTGRAQPRMLIDLNIPHVPPCFLTDESLLTDMLNEHNSGLLEKSSSVFDKSEQPQLAKPPQVKTSEQQEPILNGRRQSTRNRPLSTRALEALACGFLGTEKKRKSPESHPRRSDRRVRGRPAKTISFSTGTSNDAASSSIKEGSGEIYTGSSSSIICEPHQV